MGLFAAPLNTHTHTHTQASTQILVHAVCSLYKHGACHWLSFMSAFPVCNLNEGVPLKACLGPTDLKLAKWQTESGAGEHNDTETWDKAALLRRISECKSASLIPLFTQGLFAEGPTSS